MFTKSFIWSFVFVILAGGALYHTSYEVQSRQEQLSQLKQHATEKRENIHILKAELSFLSSPERIKRLADTHLMLFPTEPAQLATLATLPQRDLSITPTDRKAFALASAPLPALKPLQFTAMETAQRKQTIVNSETFGQTAPAADVRALAAEELVQSAVTPKFKPIAPARAVTTAQAPALPKYHKGDLEAVIARLEATR